MLFGCASSAAFPISVRALTQLEITSTNTIELFKKEAVMAGTDTRSYVVTAIAVIIGATIFFSPNEKASTTSSSQKSPAACGEDLSCLANLVRFDAGRACRDDIERRAKWNFEWTNWAIDGIFGQYRWLDRQARTITFSGDSLKFQNGFGAWGFVTYRCDYDPARGTVLAVRVSEGRLPKLDPK